jgi:predicted nucleotidyltransferase
MAYSDRNGEREASKERTKEVRELIQRVQGWARSRDDVRALALVGSWVRGTARRDSDVDLVVLTDHPDAFTDDDDWVRAFNGRLEKTGDWGAIVERRVRLTTGLEVEFGIGQATWASTDPVDAGTRRVVTDGMTILHDPEGLLAKLAEACRT